MAASSNESFIPALIRHPFVETFTWFYMALQAVLVYIFSPVPPPPTAQNLNIPRKRVAVIGAGLTGVSSAAHCVGHGFDVQMFEARPKEQGLGGIWSVRLPPLSEVDLQLTSYRESTRPLHCRYTVSCTASTPLYTLTAHIPPSNKLRNRSSRSGNTMTWNDVPFLRRRSPL
jgi:hypothetical protein